MHARSDMVVAMGPQHAEICAKGGMGLVEAVACELFDEIENRRGLRRIHVSYNFV